MPRIRYPKVRKVSREVADNATEEDKDKALDLVSKLLASIGMDCYIVTASNIEQVQSGTGEHVLRLQCSDVFANMHILKLAETLIKEGDLEAMILLTATMLTLKSMIRKRLIGISTELD